MVRRQTAAVIKSVRSLGAIGAVLAGMAGATLVATTAADAQGWWPWANQTPEPPRPREPVYRAPPGAPGGPPVPGQALPPGAQPGAPGAFGRPPAPGQAGNGQAGNICLQLEQRLVAESQRGGASPRDALPKIETEYRQIERQMGQAQSQVERGDCYEYFLFTKTLRNTPQCRGAAGQVESLKRRLAELEAQRQQIVGSSDRRYRDDIVRELARNGCGNQYVQEARKLDQGAGGLWTTEEDTSPRAGNQFGSLPFATYRTVCVRLCDGYYFPVSFSTLPNHFQRDADVCQSRCAAPVELYYHQNPGGAMEQAVSARSQSNYAALKTAFKYRKEFVQGCSCKEAEYVPPAGDKKAEAAPSAGPAISAAPPRGVPRGAQQN